MPSLSDDILAAAVAAIGGAPRAGQQAMADAIDHAFAAGEHLLVQAGTGTGKSLAYLLPFFALTAIFVSAGPLLYLVLRALGKNSTAPTA